MPNRSVLELTDRLAKLPPLQFETFVYKVVASARNATHVRRNVRIEGVEVDVIADLDGETVVFESKRISNFSMSRADAIVGFALRAREVASHDGAALDLARHRSALR